MTMRTAYEVTCSCGHVGRIRMSENDQPYSKSWEKYTLEDLDGSGYYVEGFATFEEVFDNMRPRCPACGQILRTEHMQSS